MGATPRQRADDIHAAFADPDVKAVFTSIGGDDQITVLPLLDRELLRANPKPFFGLSDNTNPRVRCTGAAVGYNLGGVLGGALTPVVATAVAQGGRVPWGVGAYLTGIAVLSLGCFALLPETRPVRLTTTAEAEAAAG
jgi:hypothetical protein